ncbi:Por secretion system C-terminal sorting domain-containing protein, partial [Mariniphaga anaerophila]
VVKATDTEGAFATDTFRLCVEGYPVSAEDISAEAFSVNLYPNPARNNVNLEIKSSGYGPVDVSVYTITGKEVLRRNFSNSSVVTFSMAEQVSGVYFVKLQKDGQLAVKKLVLESK